MNNGNTNASVAMIAIPVNANNANQNMSNTGMVQMIPTNNLGPTLFSSPENNYNIQSNFLPRILIILALYASIVFAAVSNADWWNNHANLKDTKWVFTTTTTIVCLLFLFMLYTFLWYRCLIAIRLKTDLYFIITILFFFISFMTTFINKNPDISLPFGIFCIMSMVYLSSFIWTNCGTIYGILSLIQIVCMFYFIAEVYVMQRCP